MPVINIVVITISVTLVVLVLLAEYAIRWVNNRSSDPVIGYKKAKLCRFAYGDSGEVTSLRFTGVVGVSYDVDDEAKDPDNGFHMYSNIGDAYNHPQDGEVLLEVLGYGKVVKHAKGYVATRQRVLQVILGDCVVCGNQASYIQRSVGRYSCRCADDITQPGIDLEKLAQNECTMDVVFAPFTALPNVAAFVPTTMKEK